MALSTARLPTAVAPATSALFVGAALNSAVIATTSTVAALVAVDVLGQAWGGVPGTAAVVGTGLGALLVTSLTHRAGTPTALRLGYLASTLGAAAGAVAVPLGNVGLLVGAHAPDRAGERRRAAVPVRGRRARARPTTRVRHRPDRLGRHRRRRRRPAAPAPHRAARRGPRTARPLRRVPAQRAGGPARRAGGEQAAHGPTTRRRTRRCPCGRSWAPRPAATASP